MGTNYYLVKNKPSVQEPIHIGKSSAGWRFLFKENAGDFDSGTHWSNYNELIKCLTDITKKGNYIILDESDRQHTLEEFIKFVEEKQQNDNPENFKHCRNVEGYRFTGGDFS